LGQYVKEKTGKQLVFLEGYCPVHAGILAEDIQKAKQEHPDAEVLVHPECSPEVIALADKVFSTTGMVNYAKKAESSEMIIGTEIGILYRLQKDNPGKKFYAASQKAICENMKKNSLKKVLWSLENLKHEIKVEERTRRKAKEAIDRMLEIGRMD
jgi:quinolinate synthase